VPTCVFRFGRHVRWWTILVEVDSHWLSCVHACAHQQVRLERLLGPDAGWRAVDRAPHAADPQSCAARVHQQGVFVCVRPWS
jgi:hypothetical protein